MLKHLNRISIIILVVITFLFVFASGMAQAEMYKWRNANGLLQYSDVLPLDKISKDTRKDTISSLQAASQKANFAQMRCQKKPLIPTMYLQTQLLVYGIKNR